MIGFYSSYMAGFLRLNLKHRRVVHKKLTRPFDPLYRGHLFEVFNGDDMTAIVTEHVSGPRWKPKKHNVTVDLISHGGVKDRKHFSFEEMEAATLRVKLFG